MSFFNRALNLVGDFAKKVAVIAGGTLMEVKQEAAKTIQAIRQEYLKRRRMLMAC
jgi:soluble cytochrome b562